MPIAIPKPGDYDALMLVLGLEATCDETAAAIVDMAAPEGARIRANIVHSQLDDHRAYGGVVPEIAARAHVQHMPRVVAAAIAAAGVAGSELGLVAATAGPGLIGGLVVSATLGRAFAQGLGLPYQDTNHLAGHALTARLTHGLPYPYLLLLVSGGHCQLLEVRGPLDYVLLGTTMDDAVGEAFDKVAKMLGLSFPGGPAVEVAARDGDADRFPLPMPLKRRPGLEFSFSGLKTAVRRQIELLEGTVSDQDKADLAASFQRTVAVFLAKRTRSAMLHCQESHGHALPLAVAGGVAANGEIRAGLETVTQEFGVQLCAAPLPLCGDNAAMIAYAGGEIWQARPVQIWDMAPRPRWPLGELKRG